jgi:hypothetical protein
MAVVGGTHFPVKRDTIAQTCTRQDILVPNHVKKKRVAYHSNTCTRSIFLLRSGRKVQMYVYHGIGHAQRVLRALIGDAKIVRVRLDPTECKLCALFDYLDSHQQNFDACFTRGSKKRERTSPSEPVSLRFPLPGVAILSTGMISPSPMPVTTRPQTTPHLASRSRSS